MATAPTDAALLQARYTLPSATVKSAAAIKLKDAQDAQFDAEVRLRPPNASPALVVRTFLSCFLWGALTRLPHQAFVSVTLNALCVVVALCGGSRHRDTR